MLRICVLAAKIIIFANFQLNLDLPTFCCSLLHQSWNSDNINVIPETVVFLRYVNHKKRIHTYSACISWKKHRFVQESFRMYREKYLLANYFGSCAGRWFSTTIRSYLFWVLLCHLLTHSLTHSTLADPNAFRSDHCLQSKWEFWTFFSPRSFYISTRPFLRYAFGEWERIMGLGIERFVPYYNTYYCSVYSNRREAVVWIALKFTSTNIRL